MNTVDEGVEIEGPTKSDKSLGEFYFTDCYINLCGTPDEALSWSKYQWYGDLNTTPGILWIVPPQSMSGE